MASVRTQLREAISERAALGGFNRTSQHLDHGGVHGTKVRMDGCDC